MAQATPGPADRAKALLKFGTQASWGARFQEAEKALRDAAEAAKAAKDERLHARALARLMYAVAYQGRLGELGPAIAEAGKLAVAGGADEVAELLIETCFIRFLPPEDASLVPMIQGILKRAEKHPKDGDVALALGQVALIVNGLGDRELAKQLLERALPVVEAVHGLGADYGLMLHNLADVALSLDDPKNFERYEPAYRRAVAIQEKALAPKHPERVAPLMNLGLFLGRRGAYEEADGLLQRALAIALEVEGPEGGTVQMVHQALSALEERLLDAKAEPYVLKRLEAAEKGGKPAELASRLVSTYRHYVARDKPKSAEPHYRKLHELLGKLSEEERMFVGAEMNVTGKTYGLLNEDKAAEAEKFLLAELDVMQRVLPAGHPEILSHLYFTGNAYRMMGRPKDSRKTFERLVEAERKGGSASPDSLARLLDAQLSLGEKKDAEKTATEIERLTGKKPVMDPALNEFARQLRNVWMMLQLQDEPDLIGAALNGDPGAILVVGFCYAAGQGVPKNMDKARTWFEAAAKAGHPTAVKVLEMGPELAIDMQVIASAAQNWFESQGRG